MNTTPIARIRRDAHWILLGAVLFAAWSVRSGRAADGLPVPSFVIYGEVLDIYGWPIIGADGAQMVVTAQSGEEVGRYPVHEDLGPSLNYRAEIPLDGGQDGRYARYAARVGEALGVALEVDGMKYPILSPVELPIVGEPGAQLRQDLSLGVDEDDDGLFDDWEWWLIDNSGGFLFALDDVAPDDDFDGDGASNREEHDAGTDPAWAMDLPLIEATETDFENGVISLAILTVPGRTYRILASSGVGSGPADWQPQPVTVIGASSPASYWRGDGQLTWVAVKAPDSGSWFLQLEAR